MNRNAIVALVAIVVVVAGLTLAKTIKKPVTPADQSTTAETSQSQNPSNANSTEDGSNTPSSTNTVTFDGAAFSPSAVKVKAGDQITVVNKSSRSIQPASDPHPSHTDNPELNFGAVAAGASKSVTVSKMGTWGVHDHLSPSIKFSVTVQ